MKPVKDKTRHPSTSFTLSSFIWRFSFFSSSNPATILLLVMAFFCPWFKFTALGENLQAEGREEPGYFSQKPFAQIKSYGNMIGVLST
jgi:ribose/xylose/arabinose/galactoside ABC-type transport system permease subunit